MASKNRCTGCKCYFKTETMIQKPIGRFCTEKCMLEYAFKPPPDNAEKVRKLAKKEDNLRKKALKPKSKWLGELQAVVNKYVRLRDLNDGCISCEKAFDWVGQWHASHYYSRGHSSSLRFNLWNIHKSCSVCNSHLSGNIGQYTPRLIAKIGVDKFDYLVEHKSDVSLYTTEWIERAIRIARKSVKRIEKRLE